jgi:hypothetical protein
MFTSSVRRASSTPAPVTPAAIASLTRVTVARTVSLAPTASTFPARIAIASVTADLHRR